MKRLWFLLWLTASVLLIRGFDVYYAYFLPTLSWRAVGMLVEVEDGFLVVQSIVEKSSGGEETAAYKAGLKKKDKILAITNADGQKQVIDNTLDYGKIWSTVGPEEPWSVEILRSEGGSEKKLFVDVPGTPAKAGGIQLQLLYLLFGLVLPFVAIATAAFIGFMKPQDNNAFVASLLFFSFSSIFSVASFYFPAGVVHYAIFVNTSLASFSAYLFMRFFLLFPSRSLIDKKAPWLKNVFLGINIALWLFALAASFAATYSFSAFQNLVESVSFLKGKMGYFPIAMFVVGLLSLFLHTRTAESKDEKRKLVILLLGAILGLLPLMVYFLYLFYAKTVPPLWSFVLLAFSLAIFPLSFIYVVLRHRVLGIRLIIRRGLQYALISRGFFVIESVLIFVVFYFALGTIEWLQFSSISGVGGHALITAILAIGLAAVMRKVNLPIMTAVDKRFFREAYSAHQILTDLSRAVRKLATNPERLFDLISDKISDSLYPAKVAIFLLGAKMVATPSHGEADGDTKQICRLVLDAGDEYRCCGLRVRSGHHDETWCKLEDYQHLSLPASSFVARYLDELDSDDPLDVYLNDPKSWANALARVTSENDAYYEEKRLIEQLNTKLLVPLVTGDQVLGFISLGEKLSEEAYSKEDKQLLMSVAEQTAIALDFARMIAQVSEQEKLKRELQIAKEVQARLFPQTLPTIATIDYTGYCKSALGIGGDYYDFLHLGHGKLGIALGDVSGKGIYSALLMASLQALLRSSAPLRGDALDQLMSDINRLMCASTEGNKYATFFYGVYDSSYRQFTYVNAGHNPPILFRRDGNGSGSYGDLGTLTLPVKIERLTTGGMVVGMLGDAVYEKETVVMDSGDILVLFSDGISEAMNDRMEEFGEERILNVINANQDRSAVEIRDVILRQVSEFVGSAPQHDDQTLVVVKIC